MAECARVDCSGGTISRERGAGPPVETPCQDPIHRTTAPERDTDG